MAEPDTAAPAVCPERLYLFGEELNCRRPERHDGTCSALAHGHVPVEVRWLPE